MAVPQTQADDEALERVADELYGLPAERFTAARNEQARIARASGDRGLAEEVARLPKPSAAAALVNLFVRHRSEQFDQMVQLGDALRRAQADLDPRQLRELTTQRRRLVRALADEARLVGDEAGQSVSASVLDGVEQTLNAVILSAQAAAAVRTGRLVRPLLAEGLGPVDLTDAVGAPAGNAPIDLASRRRSKAETAEEGRRRREREEAEAAVREAQQAAEEARRQSAASTVEVHRAEERADALERDADDLRSRLEDLRRRLAEVDEALESAEAELLAARQASRASARAVRAADAAVADASDRLRRLG